MQTPFRRAMKTAGLLLAVTLAGDAFGQKSVVITPERLSQIETQMQVSEEPKTVNIGIEVTAMSESVFLAGMEGSNNMAWWARQYADTPVHQLTVSGRHAVAYAGLGQQPPTEDVFELILLAEDSKDLDACRDMAANALTRSTSAGAFGGSPRPILFHMQSDKGYVKSIYNPWKSTRVTVTLKPRNAEDTPQFVSCYLWSGSIWGVP